MKQVRLPVIIEKSDDQYSARVEDKGKFPVANGYGNTIKKAMDNLVDVIKDYQAHEGKTDRFWKNIKADSIAWVFYYDVQAFFEQHDFLNQTKVAELAGINPGLLRQYASGVKHPGTAQVKKIRNAILKLATELINVELVA